jgi:hypothetical protein
LKNYFLAGQIAFLHVALNGSPAMALHDLSGGKLVPVCCDDKRQREACTDAVVPSRSGVKISRERQNTAFLLSFIKSHSEMNISFCAPLALSLPLTRLTLLAQRP